MSCRRCWLQGFATGVAAWYLAAVVWAELSDRQEALDRECDRELGYISPEERSSELGHAGRRSCQ